MVTGSFRLRPLDCQGLSAQEFPLYGQTINSIVVPTQCHQDHCPFYGQELPPIARCGRSGRVPYEAPDGGSMSAVKNLGVEEPGVWSRGRSPKTSGLEIRGAVQPLRGLDA